MQQRPLILTIIIIAAFSWLPLSAQTLTPQELTQIHQMADPGLITKEVSKKGFEWNGHHGNAQTKETRADWSFSVFSGDDKKTCSFLSRIVDSIEHARTILTLYNPYHYKAFIDGLKNAGYEFSSTQIIDNRNYLSFKNRTTEILTIEKQVGSASNYCEIIVRILMEKKG